MSESYHTHTTETPWIYLLKPPQNGVAVFSLHTPEWEVTVSHGPMWLWIVHEHRPQLLMILFLATVCVSLIGIAECQQTAFVDPYTLRHAFGRYFVAAVAAMDTLISYSSSTPNAGWWFCGLQSLSVTQWSFTHGVGLPYAHFPVAQRLHFVSK